MAATTQSAGSPGDPGGSDFIGDPKYQHPADCFCLTDREEYHLTGWCNEGIAVDFIVQAVRDRMAATAGETP